MKDNIDFGQGVTYDRSRDRFAYDGSKGPLENLSLDRPFKVVYELLYACNLACQFCMKDFHTGSAGNVKSLLEKLVENGPMRTTLSGGEPSLIKNLEDLLAHGVDIGHIFHLVSNATQLKPSRGLVDAVSMFEIGLDGANADVYQAMRGSDVFENIKGKIVQLVQLGARVRITHVLSAVNADSAHLMPKVCADLGVQKLRFQRFIPYGEGKNHVKKFHIEDSNVDRVVEATMVEAEKAGIEFLPPPAKQFYYGALYVRPDGELMYRDGDGEYDGERSIGNLHAAPLSQIWTKEMGANHRKIVIDQPRFGNKTS